VFFGKMSGGYFNSRLEEMPLLHTWSLSAEEQFYLVWAPVIIFLGWRRLFVPLLLAAAAASIVASWYATEQGWPSAYFLLQYRAFELIIGATLALLDEHGLTIRSRLMAQIAGLLGIFLILSTVFLLQKTDPFPGLLALLPTFGSALVIASGRVSEGFVARLLSLRPMVGIGLISYALYLWHWPLIVFLRYAQIPQSHLAWWLVGPLATLLAWASWKYVEVPLRTNSLLGNGASVLRFFVAPALLSYALFALVHLSNGLPERFSGQLRQLMTSYSQEFDFGRSCSWPTSMTSDLSLDVIKSQCHIGKAGTPAGFLLIGDSHGNHFKPFVDEVARAGSLGGVYHLQGGCSPVEGLTPASNRQPSREACYERNRRLLDMASEFKFILLASRWSSAAENPTFEHDLELLVQRIQKAGARPILLQEVPNSSMDLSRCPLYAMRGWIDPATRCDIPFRDVESQQFYARQVIHNLQVRHPAMLVVDVRPLTCDDQYCATTINGAALYRDADHINAKASALLGQAYIQRFPNPFAPSHVQ
jgi:hypothetical protein